MRSFAYEVNFGRKDEFKGGELWEFVEIFERRKEILISNMEALFFGEDRSDNKGDFFEVSVEFESERAKDF